MATLATLSLVNPVTPQNAPGSGVIQNDVYFYGQSPPFYPTPEISGIGGWDEALSKAQALVSRMSLEEKIQLTGGQKNETTSCGGYIPGISRLGLEVLRGSMAIRQMFMSAQGMIALLVKTLCRYDTPANIALAGINLSLMNGPMQWQVNSKEGCYGESRSGGTRSTG